MSKIWKLQYLASYRYVWQVCLQMSAYGDIGKHGDKFAS